MSRKGTTAPAKSSRGRHGGNRGGGNRTRSAGATRRGRQGAGKDPQRGGKQG